MIAALSISAKEQSPVCKTKACHRAAVADWDFDFNCNFCEQILQCKEDIILLKSQLKNFDKNDKINLKHQEYNKREG